MYLWMRMTVFATLDLLLANDDLQTNMHSFPGLLTSHGPFVGFWWELWGWVINGVDECVREFYAYLPQLLIATAV